MTKASGCDLRDPARLARDAEELELIAGHLSRPGTRVHLLERAATYRAMIALVSAGAPREMPNGSGAP
jgi:hypothetical protein